MKFISRSPKPASYESVTWHESKAAAGACYATRRVSLAQRIELTSRVRELTDKYEFLKAGDGADQLEASLAELLTRRLYIEWGLSEIKGIAIDGEPATVESVIERGPETLTEEIVGAIQAELGLSEEERKNF